MHTVLPPERLAALALALARRRRRARTWEARSLALDAHVCGPPIQKVTQQCFQLTEFSKFSFPEAKFGLREAKFGLREAKF